MNQKLMKLIAVLLISLIVSLPFYSSSALVRAASPTGVELVKAYGSDNIEGYARPGETVTVQANIYTGSEVKADNVLIGSSKFQTCTPKYPGTTDTLYYCRYVGFSPGSSTAPIPITVSVSGTAYSKSTDLIIDSQVPQIALFGVEEQVIGPGESTFNYRITDTACTGSACAGKCPGIKRILLYDEEDGTSFEQLFNPPITNINNCEASGTIKWEPIQQTKDVIICAKAYDMFNLESTGKCVTFHKDVTGPEASQLQIIKNSVPVEWVGPTGISADVIARLPVDVASARADLQQLNNDPSYANKIGACVKNEADGYTECTWSNVLLQVTANKQGTVMIKATDSSGNTKDTSLSFSLKYDGTVPAVDFFGTTKSYDDVSYAKAARNTFLIRFTEAQSGFHNKNVFIDLSELNSGYGANKQADECRQESGKWVCYWNDISVTAAHGSTQRVDLQDGTGDDAGNLVHTVTIASVKVDKTPPTITKVAKRVDEAVDACPTSGEVLTFDVEGQEDSDRLTLKINASLISEHQDLIEEECVKQTDKWVCSIGVDQLYSNYRNKNVKIILEDIAGNTEEQNLQVEVCEADTTTASDHLNFITFTPETPPTIPGQIDRKLASKIPATIYVPLQFTTTGATFSIIRDDNCAETEWIDGEPFIINQYSDEPMLVLKIKRADYSSVDKIDINCKLFLRVRKGHKVYANPEIEGINVTAPLYDLPLGQPSENMRAEMQKTINEINGVTKEINELKKKNSGLKQACNLLEMLAKLNNVLSKILQIVQAVTCIWSFVPGQQAAADNAWKSTCTPISGVQKFINSILNPPMFSGIGSDRKFNAFGGLMSVLEGYCMQYSCRLCNPEIAAEWVVDTAAGAGAFDKIGISKDTTYGNLRSGNVWVSSDGQFSYVDPASNWDPTQIDPGNVKYNEATKRYEFIDGPYKGKWMAKASPDDVLPLTSLFGSVFSGGGRKPEFDPFHDINAANACFCTPAKIFNKKKLRQIQCMYYSCLKQHAELGLSPATCSIAYAERNCLYYEGADSKKSNYFSQVLKNLPLQILFKFINVLTSKFLVCDQGCETACGGTVKWICALKQSMNFANAFENLKNTFKFTKNQDNPELAGPDYCAGLGVDSLA